MIRYLGLDEVLELHRRLIEQSGGSKGLRDHGALDSALAQPTMGFGGEELYPSLIDKAAAMGFSLIANHPFADGNKRIGHLAMEMFLVLNGYEIIATVSEQEQVILSVAAGTLRREAFTNWLAEQVRGRGSEASGT